MAPSLQTIGWREWVTLPGLGVDFIKAKVDTGARTSSLHAVKMERFQENGVDRVRFQIHPVQRRTTDTIHAVADVYDVRTVTPSTGRPQERIVILTPVTIFRRTWDIELTLAHRDNMGFRMLLGRQAIRKRMLVDPGASYKNGKPGSGRKG